jgi:hypothetical protein
MAESGAQAKVRIFAGPSRLANLPIPEIDWAPPARAGDLRAAAQKGFRTLVLADTLFWDAPPSHREILDVIGSGIEVVGCASAGALRAVELESQGMIGAGIVFELYRDGHLTDDAEIACVLDADYRAIAPSLLDVRVILGRLAIAMGDARGPRAAFGAIAELNFLRRYRAALGRIAAVSLDAASWRLFDVWLDEPLCAFKARDLDHVARALVSSERIGPALVEPLPAAQRAWLASGLRL